MFALFPQCISTIDRMKKCRNNFVLKNAALEQIQLSNRETFCLTNRYFLYLDKMSFVLVRLASVFTQLCRVCKKSAFTSSIKRFFRLIFCIFLFNNKNDSEVFYYPTDIIYRKNYLNNNFNLIKEIRDALLKIFIISAFSDQFPFHTRRLDIRFIYKVT